jgi:replicative DNA helicase
LPPVRRDHTVPLFEKKPPVDGALEDLVIGAILRDGLAQFEIASAIISPGDYALEKNKRLFARMGDLAGRGEPIDRVTVTNELIKHEQLDSIGGLSALVSLDEGLPEITAIASYCRRLKDLSARRHLMAQAQSLMDRATDESEPVAEIISGVTESLQNIQPGQKEEEGRNPTKIVEDFPGGIEAFLDPTKQPPGVPTGFWKFDQLLGGGFRDDELAIIAARPGMGKSAIALNIASFVAVKKKKPVDFYSLEMSASSLLQRMACAHGRVDSHKLRNGYLNQEERGKMQRSLFELTESPITIFDRQSSMGGIVAHIRRRAKQADAPALVIVDYLQLIGSKGKSENRNQEISDLTRQFKLLSQLHPIILLSQLSRANEKRPGASRRPQLSDMRDGGSIEQDADIVAGIHREEMYTKDREDLRGQAELILLKNRNGPVSVVNLSFLGHYTKFENRSDDLEPWSESMAVSAEEPEPQREIIYDDASF